MVTVYCMPNCVLCILCFMFGVLFVICWPILLAHANQFVNVNENDDMMAVIINTSLIDN